MLVSPEPILTNPPAERYIVHVKATYYRDFVRIWIPDQPYIKHIAGYEPKKKPGSPPRTSIDEDEDADIYETNLERSIRRTRKSIRDYSFVNTFELFATFTFADDRHNDDRSRRRLATWLRNQRVRNGKFRYLVVPERHKDGALHFHALIGDYTGRLNVAVNPKTNKKISDGRGGYVHNFSEYTLGINSAKIIKQDVDSRTKTSFYLQKYITKDTVNEFGKNRYWASKNLKKPITVENPEPFYRVFEANRHWVIDHGTILEFDKNNNPLIDIFIEANQNE